MAAVYACEGTGGIRGSALTVAVPPPAVGAVPFETSCPLKAILAVPALSTSDEVPFVVPIVMRLGTPPVPIFTNLPFVAPVAIFTVVWPVPVPKFRVFTPEL